jgi:hypothetical protein
MLLAAASLADYRCRVAALVPYLVSKRWVHDQYSEWWHGDERSSPVWMSRVRGQFPDQAETAFIKMAWLERARERARRNPVEDTGGRLIAGVDVGGGEAETVVYLCELSKPNPKVLKFEAGVARTPAAR